MAKILSVKDLVVQFKNDEGTVTAVNNVSFDVFEGKTLGIVGESGSGKSVSVLSILQLLPTPPAIIANGEINYNGKDILQYDQEDMRKIRGKEISMIFQEPMTSLNPVFTVGDQIKEVFELHGEKSLTKNDIHDKSIEMLKLVGIPAPERRVLDYPHQLSGGMRQRVMIAMALACDPKLLIADEPTTALDVTIQAQIMELLLKLQEERQMGVILITHDLGVVAESCNDVAVMYCGKIVERGAVKDIFSRPLHPYTIGLLGSIPSFNSSRGESQERLKTIEGMVPSLSNLPRGCSFQDRCFNVLDECRGEKGEPEEKDAKGQSVRCFNPVKNGERI